MPARPSLFAHAPSELSQDAFLAWLAEWADPRFADADPTMHRAGDRFVRSLFEAAGKDPPERIGRVDVELQRGRIDVLVVVDCSTAIVIEDKVHARESGDQLPRYRQLASDMLGFAPENVLCVYLKTGDQDDTGGVEASGFKYYSRSRLLRVLHAAESDGLTHDIHADFLAHVAALDERVGAWRTLPMVKWGAHDDLWRGLLDALQDRLGEGGWRWVNNRGGGFYGMWWCWREVDGGALYLQADSAWSQGTTGRFGVRFWGTDVARRRALAYHWREMIPALAQTAGVNFVPPRRMKPGGQTVQIATYAGPWLVPAVRDGLLDLDATVAVFQSCATFLRSAIVRPPDAG